MSYRIYFLVSRVSTQCRSRTYPVASGPPYNALNAAVSQLCLLHYLLRLWLSTKMPLCATPHSTAPIMQLAQFVALCHAQSFRPSRITSYVSAIAYVHKIKGLLNLGEAFLVKKLLHGTRRSQCIDKRHPFTLTQIRILITALPSVVSSKYECILFSAMFFTAFFAILRVGEFCLSSTSHQNKYMLCQPKIIDVLWAYVCRWALKVPYFSRGLLLSNHNRSFLSRDLSYIH